MRLEVGPPAIANLEGLIASQIDSMFKCLEDRADPLFSPSAFWRDLCEKHTALIKKHGFSHFKRTLNFHYGQWPVCSFRSAQILHVLRQLLGAAQFPSVAFTARMSDASSIEGPGWSASCASAYRFYVGLLWQLAASTDRMGCLTTCQESTVGNPIKITHRGRLITQDLAQSSLELNRINEHTGGYKFEHVAEIGGGCGRFAYLFMHMFPQARYAIFDIPPALAISQTYLSLALGADRVVPFDPDNKLRVTRPAASIGEVAAHLPHALEEFPDGHFDLFLNVSSFDEMLPAQVERYFDLIDKKTAGWLYVKGYSTRSGADRTRPWGLRQFPYRSRWRLVYEGVDALHPAFTERLYDLREQR
jgi:putative sugar O-methyltransferase